MGTSRSFLLRLIDYLVPGPSRHYFCHRHYPIGTETVASFSLLAFLITFCFSLNITFLFLKCLLSHLLHEVMVFFFFLKHFFTVVFFFFFTFFFKKPIQSFIRFNKIPTQSLVAVLEMLSIFKIWSLFSDLLPSYDPIFFLLRRDCA